jgi:hypothetical protein
MLREKSGINQKVCERSGILFGQGNRLCNKEPDTHNHDLFAVL